MAELWQPGPGSPRGDNKADVNPRHGKADLRPQRPGLRPCSSTTKEAHPFFWSFREEKVPKDEWQSWAIGGDPGEGRKGQSWPSDPWGGWGERIQAKQLALEASWRWGGNLGHGWLWDTQVTKFPHHCPAITIIHQDKKLIANFFWANTSLEDITVTVTKTALETANMKNMQSRLNFCHALLCTNLPFSWTLSKTRSFGREFARFSQLLTFEAILKHIIGMQINNRNF